MSSDEIPFDRPIKPGAFKPKLSPDDKARNMMEEMNNDTRPQVLTPNDRRWIADYWKQYSAKQRLSSRQRKVIRDIHKRFLENGGTPLDQEEWPEDIHDYNECPKTLDDPEFADIKDRLYKSGLDIREMLQPGGYQVEKAIDGAELALKEYRAILDEVPQEILILGLFKDYFARLREYRRQLKELKARR
jgi:hypothetical protein